MTPDEKARAEALGVMRVAREQVGLTVQEQARYVEGFVAGSAWQRSQPVEITEAQDEQEALAEILYETYQDAAGVSSVGSAWLDEFSKHYAAIIIAAGYTRRPMPSRDEIADEVSGIQVGSGYYATVIGRDAALEAADAVLALFAAPGGDS